MMCKVNKIFDEIFKIYTQIKKSGFTELVKEVINKMSALNNFRKKELL